MSRASIVLAPLLLFVVLATVFAAADDAGVAHAPAPHDGGVDAGDGGPDAAVAGPSDGRYRIEDAAACDAAMNTAVDAAIASLHPSMREPFRAQFRASLRAPRTLRVAHHDSTVSITFDTTVFTAPIGAAAISQPGLEGRPVQVTHRLDAGALVQEARNRQFQRTDRLVAVGDAIRLEIELRSGLLPRPLTLVATYARAGAEPGDAAVVP